MQIFDDALPGFGISAFAGGKRSYLGVDVAAEKQAKKVLADKKAATLGSLINPYLKAK